ncbi:manganese catalase family protein [Acetonema longum]|uniref:Catalase n=1 Tax=Acetonema longum DSM 6540 TaxID=1009370 RepID=F7NJ27_9FIRM|nr:manganese catalase family protein [Acetonema longum]EGO64024.1 Catalase [Acetonema longum DSM 6540]
MWIYEKKLEHPVKISCPDVAFAKLVITQYGGPDGELSASLRYLNQRYSMPFDNAKALLTDIGTEELAHMEMIAALVYKLTEGACPEDYQAAGWGGQYVQHDNGLFWTDANGIPWSAKYIAALGDPITDLVEDMAAEQKARATYEHLIQMTSDPCVKDMLRFLWEREVVHFQRFGEMLNTVQDWQAQKQHLWCGHRPPEEETEED